MPAQTPDIRATLRDMLARVGKSGHVELQPLPGGCTNYTALATVDGERYVVRVASAKSAELRICRETEFRVWQAAADVGIAPTILHRDHDRGVLIYKFVEGHHWEPYEIERPENLARLAQLLRATHSLRAEASRFDPVSLGLEFQRRVAREKLPAEIKSDLDGPRPGNQRVCGGGARGAANLSQRPGARQLH